ncbi:molybdenum cofactor guanylyltransferase [Extibacter muris]|uniref:molybdenum cofactor guanylyltransferase n=1 Tax=Extibacter muris TaxID=1796622 RepID=UPI001FAA07C4|nr:molybdenum cofactor guanylyltransferase [Extibacter muris]MCU0078797.1 molybdenum cofactor guanylyltransferase [Extibacter muris]
MDRSVAGYILAGGKNTRMGGRKKLLLDYKGKSFYEWLKESLRDTGAVYVSVEGRAPYECLDTGLISDIYKDAGPLGGILSGLKMCMEEALLVVPCDMVPVPEGLLKALLDTYRRTGRPVCPSAGGRPLPLPAVYVKGMLPAAEALIGEGDYRLSRLWNAPCVQYETVAADTISVANVNTSEDYAMLEEDKDGHTRRGTKHSEKPCEENR